jgi:Rha family phage regulatory protein
MTTLKTALVSDDMRTDSLRVAEHFKKPHATVLRAIQRLAVSDAFGRSNYAATSYIDSWNRTQAKVEMTRDGFAMLAMGFTGREASEWKEKYLAAFNAMESKLAKDADKLEWKSARLGIKQVRRSFTDTVADFVAYAKAQGSESAERYYSNLTKMEYKALGLLEMQKTAIGNFRDTLDIIDIAYLNVAEITAKVAIEEGMAAGVHYKEIYQLAKQRVTDYANVMSISRPSKYTALSKV